jgi:hypothetical protein
VSDHKDRAPNNDKSRNSATHHRELWSKDELDFLLELWQKEPEADVAAVLGRTIEACRQRFYEARQGLSATIVHKSTRVTITETTTRYIGSCDTDEDRWWDSSYYTTND